MSDVTEGGTLFLTGTGRVAYTTTGELDLDVGESGVITINDELDLDVCESGVITINDGSLASGTLTYDKGFEFDADITTEATVHAAKFRTGDGLPMDPWTYCAFLLCGLALILAALAWRNTRDIRRKVLGDE